MRLSTLQSSFLGWLASGEESDAACLPLRRAEGLAVYQNNYRANLMSCLAETFPQTLAWLGDEAFYAAAATHIDRVPPHSWTLDDYADGFPASLQEAFGDDHEVSELSLIELALSHAFVAEDAPVLRPEQMAGLDWDAVCLQAIPALSILMLSTNAADLWAALAEGETPPAAQECAPLHAVLVWRREGLCRLRVLEEGEAALLALLLSGPLEFGQLCEQAISRWGEEQGVLSIGQWLSRWVCDGLIIAPVE